MKQYRIGVALGCCCKRTLTVTAENAIDAVITGLCEMGLTTLALVTGITICEVYL